MEIPADYTKAYTKPPHRKDRGKKRTAVKVGVEPTHPLYFGALLLQVAQPFGEHSAGIPPLSCSASASSAT